jgi:hypothetical protein
MIGERATQRGDVGTGRLFTSVSVAVVTGAISPLRQHNG